MLAGLLVAAFAPTILSIPIITAILMRDDAEMPRPLVGIGLAMLYLLLAEAWSLLAGLIAVYTLPRWRGQLGRLGCLAIGGICSVLFVIFLMLCGTAIFEADFWGFIMGEFIVMTVGCSLPAALLGIFGGWIFWRFSVRPAATPTTELAPVFD